jgi:pentatricopeptide repeat protein
MLQLRAAHAGESLHEAIANLEATVRADPRDGAGWFGLCNALGRAGRWERAASAYREAVARGLQVAALHHNLGTALRTLGDEAGAQAAFERALSINPGYARSRAALAKKP